MKTVYLTILIFPLLSTTLFAESPQDISDILGNNIFYTIDDDSELKKQLIQTLNEQNAKPQKKLQKIVKIRDSLFVRKFLIKELTKDLKYACLTADSILKECSEIANNSRDEAIRKKATAIVNSIKLLTKEMGNMNTLTYEKALVLFANSKAIFCDADELRYEILVKQFFQEDFKHRIHE